MAGEGGVRDDRPTVSNVLNLSEADIQTLPVDVLALCVLEDLIERAPIWTGDSNSWMLGFSQTYVRRQAVTEGSNAVTAS